MQTIWALANINLYEILCPPKLKGYVDDHAIEVSKGQVIYSDHYGESKIYLVSKGKVKIVTYDNHGNETVKLILSRGELFGEKHILGDVKSREFAIACNNPTEVCAINIGEMRKLMRKNERFESSIYKFIGLRLRKIERRLELLIGKDVDTRIISFVHDLYEDIHSPIIANTLSHSDISKLLGTSRESVTKVFNRLKKEGIIEYNRKEIIVTDHKKLCEMSGD
jgi:CRP-like cAMP-binding protein